MVERGGRNFYWLQKINTFPERHRGEDAGEHPQLQSMSGNLPARYLQNSRDPPVTVTRHISLLPLTTSRSSRSCIRKICGILGIFLLILSIHSSAQERLQELKADKDARMRWWTDARFGMFIHFGLYSIPAGILMSCPRRSNVIS